MKVVTGTGQRRSRSTRRRGYAALVACLLWVFGFEVVPWLHMALHDRIGAHTHQGLVIVHFDGAIEHEHPHTHEADLEQDLRISETPHERAVRHFRDAETRLRHALEHGHGSLAHHDVALIPWLALPEVPVVIRHASVLAFAVELVPIDALAPRANARGPPALLAS